MWDILKSIIIVYWGVISIITFAAFGIDKWKAVKGKWRIPEKDLFLMAAFGGTAGAVVGMMVFHHKTKKYKFTIGMPLLLTVQILVVIGLYMRCFSM
ncbi:MAG: DUF1294 domain-containing protein [Eubacteriales bacterium]|nr:DUF1294 domain-containing protein [Eubacteriales bacterium]